MQWLPETCGVRSSDHCAALHTELHTPLHCALRSVNASHIPKACLLLPNADIVDDVSHNLCADGLIAISRVRAAGPREPTAPVRVHGVRGVPPRRHRGATEPLEGRIPDHQATVVSGHKHSQPIEPREQRRIDRRVDGALDGDRARSLNSPCCEWLNL